jgi:type I restriction-modification system DNA methylase subunit
MPDLESAELANEHLLLAIRNLGLVKDRSGWRLVDYRNLGSEELGSVYESLLELNPTMELPAGIFTLDTVAGNQRKTSGSYYTPDSLVQCLLDSALDPVVEQAIKGKTPAEAEKAILALKVCDPAVGSGHFLVGAAHRLAKHLANVRAQAQGESEPSPLYYQHALRDVIGHCLYGVDVNPMAAELCRVSLWLEAIEPGKPLSFLDHHIRVGNSLLGATPALLAKGNSRRGVHAHRRRRQGDLQPIQKGEQDRESRIQASLCGDYRTVGAAWRPGRQHDSSGQCSRRLHRGRAQQGADV